MATEARFDARSELRKHADRYVDSRPVMQMIRLLGQQARLKASEVALIQEGFSQAYMDWWRDVREMLDRVVRSIES